MPLQVQSTCEFSAYPSSRNGTVGMVLGFDAPEVVETQRKPLDVICVLDKSGSMAGAKMELMKAAMQFSVTQLKPQDRLAIVLFDTNVHTALPLINMDQAGAERAKATIHGIRPGSCTNLSGGLFEGIAQLQRRSAKADVCSVLLFTDGHANNGVKDKGSLVRAVDRMLPQISGCTLHTFGFGGDHNADMLRALAETGNGMYNYIETPESIPESFANCLGGLLNVAVQNMEVEVTFPAGVTPGDMLDKGYRHQVSGNKIVMHVPDMFAEEHKDLFFQANVTTCDADAEFPLATIAIRYMDVQCGKLQEHTVPFTLNRGPDAAEQPSHPAVDKARNRLVVADIVQRAAAMSTAAAVKELTAVVTFLEASSTAEDPFVQGLIGDVRHMISELQSRDRHQVMQAQNSCHAWARSQQVQRAATNKCAYTSHAAYQTPQQCAAVAASPGGMALRNGYGSGPHPASAPSYDHYPMANTAPNAFPPPPHGAPPSMMNWTPPTRQQPPSLSLSSRRPPSAANSAANSRKRPATTRATPPRSRPPPPAPQSSAMSQPRPRVSFDLPPQQQQQQQFPQQQVADDKACLICMARPKEMVAVPCGHVIACQSCGPKYGTTSCPVCRAPMQHLVLARF